MYGNIIAVKLKFYTFLHGNYLFNKMINQFANVRNKIKILPNMGLQALHFIKWEIFGAVSVRYTW